LGRVWGIITPVYFTVPPLQNPGKGPEKIVSFPSRFWSAGTGIIEKEN
jgi:hypothetical protein